MVECLDFVSLSSYYSKIIHYLFSKVKDKGNINFNELKERFRVQVNSNRRFEYINDIQNLIEVLEKRSEINMFKTDLLEKIYDFYDIDKIVIYEHNQFLHSCSFIQQYTLKGVNVYAIELQKEKALQKQVSNERCEASYAITDQQQFIKKSEENYFCNAESRKPFHKVNFINVTDEENTNRRFLLPERVIELMSSVGSKWKYLARNLSLNENTIDQIDDDVSLNLEAKIRKVLLSYQSTCIKDLKEDKIQIGLIQALTKIKRNDLRIDVEEYFERLSLKYKYSSS